LRSDISNLLLDLVETGHQVKTYKRLRDTDEQTASMSTQMHFLLISVRNQTKNKTNVS